MGKGCLFIKCWHSYLFGNGIGPLYHPIYKNKDKIIKCTIVTNPEDYMYNPGFSEAFLIKIRNPEVIKGKVDMVDYYIKIKYSV